MVITATLGLDTNNSFTYQLFTLVSAITLLSWLSSFLSKDQFEITRELPKIVCVGQPFEYWMRIRHLGKRSWNALEALETLDDCRPSFEDYSRVSNQRGGKRFLKWFWPISTFENARVEIAKPGAFPLVPGGSYQIPLKATPLRRGYLRFESCAVAQPDVLGISRSLTRIPHPQSIVVLPKRYQIPHLSMSHGQTYQRGGVALASKIGESEEFISLRDYRPGDPLRSIHWKSWSKTGKPIVKEFADEFFVRHALILDTFPSPSTNDAVFEEAVSIATSFACVLDTQESLLDLLFVGTEAFRFTAGRSVAPVDRMLEILACAEPCRTSTFSSLHRLFLGHSMETTHCICILLGWDEERKALIKSLQQLNIPALVLVLTSDEAPQLEGSFSQTKYLSVLQVRLNKVAEVLGSL